MTGQFELGQLREKVSAESENQEVAVRRGKRATTFECLKTPFGYRLTSGTKVFDVNVSYSKGDDFQVSVNGKILSIKWKDDRQSGFDSGSASGESNGIIKAVMPGRVVKIFKNVGDIVSAGESLLVLEAMKMENEVRAPSDGKIAAIQVAPGQSVEMGAILIRIDPTEGGHA